MHKKSICHFTINGQYSGHNYVVGIPAKCQKAAVGIPARARLVSKSRQQQHILARFKLSIFNVLLAAAWTS